MRGRNSSRLSSSARLHQCGLEIHGIDCRQMTWISKSGHTKSSHELVSCSDNPWVCFRGLHVCVPGADESAGLAAALHGDGTGAVRQRGSHLSLENHASLQRYKRVFWGRLD